MDFEYSAPPGDVCTPICLVAWEMRSDQRIRLWQDEMRCLASPPYAVDRNSLFVAYYASAEVGCHLALNWPPPESLLDLYAEFRNLTNGLPTPAGSGLLGAMAEFGLPTLDAAEKDAMRELALRGGPWSAEERRDLLDYCESDVRSLARLFVAMCPGIDIDRALVRGGYMRAAADIENCGVPIDVKTLHAFRRNWRLIQETQIRRIDSQYSVYEGRTFKHDRFAKWLKTHGIPWPRTDSGRLALDEGTFREMARAHPAIARLRELRVLLSQLRLNDLAVGRDARNRCLLSAFGSRTGRNQPSNSKFIFGPAVWIRGLIQPPPGRGLAYLDWSQQEFGIAAALSGDGAMMQAYQSGDPYLMFAIQAGAAPPSATKKSHGAVREQFKACVLAVQYGMGAHSLAQRIGKPLPHAEALLDMHRSTYPAFWRWSNAALDHAMLHSEIATTFGWTLKIGTKPNPRSIRNFPMQANGAEMLRLACTFAVEEGVSLCAPVHDAVLIEAPERELEERVQQSLELMGRASEIVLGGFRLRCDKNLIRHPGRFMDARGHQMWESVLDLVSHEGEGRLPPADVPTSERPPDR